MTTPMGPPPARTPTVAATAADATTATEPSPELIPTPAAEQVPDAAQVPGPDAELKPESELKISMGPPPPSSAQQSKQPPSSSHSGTVPYTIPEWSASPPHKFYLEVLKEGSIVHQLDTYEKGAYMFGRVDLCDFVLEHPTISRFHAVLQFKRNGTAYLYDLGSTHGTSINKNQVDKRVYVDLHVGDVIRFGQSSRLYIFQGPPDLMPPEADLKIHRNAKSRQEILDRKASLERARLEASLADGISWGIGEDAIEEVEDDGEEVTWQNYRGLLTEKQEKTREKILKRTEKIAHMKKEIDAIRAKDIGQGGLTQGQQTQIARNEQRMTQILEELENLEETLNESIRESLGARAGTRSRGKGTAEDDEGLSDDDDEFYDRTKKPSKEKAGKNKSVETVDTLLDKRDVIMKEMEEKKELLLLEKNKVASETAPETEAGDVLDAYMSGLSTQLVLDKTEKLEKELATLKSELDRIFFLLKIADPSGEAAKLKDSKAQEPKPEKAEAPASAINEKPPREPKKRSGLEKPTSISTQKQIITEDTTESSTKPDATDIAVEASEGKPSVYTAVKPQWLGAVDNIEKKETCRQEVANMDGPDQFVDYKDRQKILTKVDSAQANVGSEIESASPGLIIRKRKEISRPEATQNDTSEHNASSTGPELVAEDAVALLLKHSKGYQTEDLEGLPRSQESSDTSQSRKDKKKARRMLGPEKPSFLNTESEYETWVPPKGQSGDGRTSLNDRFGY